MSKKKASILSLNNTGQSIWYDNLSRDVLESGELQDLISQGVTGLTSNPSIFQKAISDSDKYDQSICRIAGNAEVDDEQLCEQLMIEDVAMAADLLRPIFDESGGVDGYASIEVSPFLARDTAGTIASAKHIWAALGRPNIMIKVPATEEGIPAVRQLLRDGINVNITLIFSGDSYKQVALAYLDALKERVDAGESIDTIASVASFFVSRVDVAVEKELDKLNVPDEQKQALLGKVGIANSVLAYKEFERLFDAANGFQQLAAGGAQVQRPLWASTGVKNPDYPSLFYVSALACPQTVNTVPPSTLAALLDSDAQYPDMVSGAFTQAEDCLNTLAAVDVDLAAILLELQNAGVESFANSYKDLLQAVGDKRKRLVS